MEIADGKSWVDFIHIRGIKAVINEIRVYLFEFQIWPRTIHTHTHVTVARRGVRVR